MSTTTFNLIDEPWISVMDRDGRVQECSVRDVLHGAAGLRRLAGDLPTQDMAVLRLLLAILHRALPVAGTDVDRARVWGGWWRSGVLPTDRLDDYLAQWSDRFDLLDPDRPFFQVAGLRTAKDGTSGLHKLIADLPAGHKYFTVRAGEGADSLRLAEAARWLVHCQAFDVSGIKSGAVGDPRVNGGKGFPIGTGWAGRLGGVVVEGSTLADTLLLNLVLAVPSPDDDRPVWEWDEVGPAATGSDSPIGPAQALTWQARRVRLVTGDENRVADCLISNGDQIRVRNQHETETMSPWRRSEAQEKAHKEDLVYMPWEHDPARAVWRGLGALLAAAPVSLGAPKRDGRLESWNVSWVGLLRELDELSPSTVVTMHTVGMSYGPQSSTVATVVSDRLAVRAELLQDRDLQQAAVRAADDARTVALQTATLAADIARAEGRDGDGVRAAAARHTFQLLDLEFRTWVFDLGGGDRTEHEDRWRRRLRSLAEDLGEAMYSVASPAAVRGRGGVDSKNRPIRLDAARAHQFYRWRLREELPLPDGQNVEADDIASDKEQR